MPTLANDKATTDAYASVVAEGHQNGWIVKLDRAWSRKGLQYDEGRKNQLCKDRRWEIARIYTQGKEGRVYAHLVAGAFNACRDLREDAERSNSTDPAKQWDLRSDPDILRSIFGGLLPIKVINGIIAGRCKHWKLPPDLPAGKFSPPHEVDENLRCIHCKEKLHKKIYPAPSWVV